MGLAMSYLGVDLHSDNFTVCRLEQSGRTRVQTFTLTKADIAKFIKSLSPTDEIAVEATGNTSWFYDQVSSVVNRVVVVNTLEFKVITQSVNKTDANDAYKLAFYLSKGMLPTTRIKTQAQDDIATLVHGRQLFVKQRTSVTNAIQSQYIRHGIRLGRDQLKSKKRLCNLDFQSFSASKQQLLTLWREQIFNLNHQIQIIEHQINLIARDLVGYEGLVSITGIGP